MQTVMTANLNVTILDDHARQPASGVRYQLYWSEDRGDVLLRAGSTDASGSTDGPLLDSTKFSAGTYKLVLHLGDYFDHLRHPNPKHFIDRLPLVFIVDDASVSFRLNVRVTPDSYHVTHA